MIDDENPEPTPAPEDPVGHVIGWGTVFVALGFFLGAVIRECWRAR
jgi:hypothetical protein